VVHLAVAIDTSGQQGQKFACCVVFFVSFICFVAAGFLVP